MRRRRIGASWKRIEAVTGILAVMVCLEGCWDAAGSNTPREGDGFGQEAEEAVIEESSSETVKNEKNGETALEQVVFEFE